MVVRPDQVSLGVLVNAVPRDLVDEAVAVCGVREKRSDGKWYDKCKSPTS